jgi:tetratricopeptide (TPR) repeat protein
MMIVSLYYSTTGNLERTIETNELFVRTYPRDAPPRNNLAFAYIRAGQYDRAIQQANVGLQNNPAIAVLYNNLLWAFRAAGRYEEAKATFERAAARQLDYEWMHVNLYLIAFALGDEAAMQRQVQWAEGKREESYILGLKAESEAFGGRFRQAAVTRRRAVDVADRDGATDNRSGTLAGGALTHAAAGDCARARTEAEAAVAGAADSFASGIAALAFAMCGEASRAQALAAALASRAPSDTVVNALLVPVIGGVIETGRGNPAEAIRQLQKAKPYERGQDLPFWPQYVRGEACTRQGLAAEAMAEFQAIIDHRSLAPAEIAYPLAYVGLARSAALAGDVPRSRKAYQDFFVLWKDADPDIPVLRQAKAEYARLK